MFGQLSDEELINRKTFLNEQIDSLRKKVMIDLNSLEDLFNLYKFEAGFPDMTSEDFKLNFICGNIIVVIDALDEILAVNSISLKLYFKTIQPLEFVETEGLDAQTKEEETGVKMCSHNLSTESIADALIEKGEQLSDEWFLIDETEVDYDTEEELDAEINALNNKKKSTLSKMWKFITSTGTARPNAKSPEQDKVIDGVQFITRYVYSGNLTGEREFCQKMLRAEKVYRKEDIMAMESKVVNSGFGKGGSDTYSIWLYKGGPRCNHKWLRRTYASFDGIKIDPTNPNAKAISSATAEKYGYRIRNEKEVSMKPSDMPTKGYTQEYWDKMGYTN